MPAKKRPAAVLEPELSGPVALGQHKAQATMDHCKRLAKAGRPFVLQQYKACKTWAAKRDFAQKLSLDKEASWLEAQEP